MNDDELNLVLDYAQNFLGFGNLDAPYWFVGLEEAGVEIPEQAIVRAKVWKEFGSGRTVDLSCYSQRVGAESEQMPWFVQNERLDPRRWFQKTDTRIQRTWQPLIRFLLAHQHQLPANNGEARENILAFQRDNWGRANSKTCLLELFGLPKAAKGRWPYANVPRIATRNLGKDETFEQRTQALQEVLHNGEENSTLKVVLFYGGVHRIAEWSKVCDIKDWNTRPLLNSCFRWQRRKQVLFLGIAHPGRGRICCDQEADFMPALAEAVHNLP